MLGLEKITAMVGALTRSVHPSGVKIGRRLTIRDIHCQEESKVRIPYSPSVDNRSDKVRFPNQTMMENPPIEAK